MSDNEPTTQDGPEKTISSRRGKWITRPIEILLLVAIFVLLVAILWPVTHIGNGSRSAKDMSNLRQIGLAIVVYANDYDDVLPAHPRDAQQYLAGATEVFLSPFQDSNAVVDRGNFDGRAVRYGGYVFLIHDISYNEIEEPSKVILAYTAKVSPEQNTRNVLFADGHVEQMEEEEELRAALPPNLDVDALDGP